jgi:hypothetical protein
LLTTNRNALTVQGNFAGLHTPHGWYFAPTSVSRVAVALLASARQPARWYFEPVRVT